MNTPGAASASAICYSGADGTTLVFSSNGEMGGGTTITDFQLVAIKSMVDYSEGVDHVPPPEGRPACVPARSLSRATKTAGALGLGMRQEEVRRLLGRPSETHGVHAIHRSEARVGTRGDRHQVRTVVVDFREGKVAAIRAAQAAAD